MKQELSETDLGKESGGTDHLLFPGGRRAAVAEWNGRVGTGRPVSFHDTEDMHILI